MGCDIHMFVEYKRDGKWMNGDYFKKNPYYKKNQEAESEDYYEKEFEVIELHGNRNYDLFSTLAGVRDYSGKIIPVAEERGLPEDVTEFVKKESDEYGCDGHTHSWLTLKEIKEYDSKKEKLTMTGLLSLQQRIDLDNGNLPEHWCQGTNQPNHERREWLVENYTLTALISKMEKRVHELLSRDWREYDAENDENIRIVFWFDN